MSATEPPLTALLEPLTMTFVTPATPSGAG